MTGLKLRSVSKSFGALEVIKNVDLEINSKEFVVFVGPSGCGKSTLLRMIAGLEEVSSGDIEIGGQRVNDVDPSKRGIAMVFQTYALYPHMTVRENMGFALALRRRAEAGDRKASGRGGAPARTRAADGPAAEGTVGRAAAARRDRPRDRQASAGVPLRRAALQPRRGTARPYARRDCAAPQGARRDDDLRHARPGRGDDARRQDRGFACRQHRADRQAVGALRRSGQPVRRRLRRVA